MTLYEEWVRTACTMEKIKKSLEAAETQLKSKEQDLETANARIKELETETGQPRFETMMRLLLEQGRTEDMRKALDDADYRELLFKELSL